MKIKLQNKNKKKRDKSILNQLQISKSIHYQSQFLHLTSQTNKNNILYTIIVQHANKFCSIINFFLEYAKLQK